MRIFITLALLFSFAFSTVHEFAFAYYDTQHCSVSEYVQEINAPSSHGDICDIHFEYHQASLLPQNSIDLPRLTLTERPLVLKEYYYFLSPIDHFKPPRT